MKKMIVMTLILAAISTPAFARRGRGRTYKSTSYSYFDNSGSDQERCQREAEYMAEKNISGHVGSCIGRFEGVGCGFSPSCNTCTPNSGMNLTGDASVMGKNGRWFRVRSWR